MYKTGKQVRLKRSGASRTYWMKIAKKQSKMLAEERRLAKERQWKRGYYFSLRGGLQAALRRSVCNGAASTLCLALGFDCHGSTITRWEVFLRACQLASMKHFMRTNHTIQDSAAASGERRLRLRIYVLRADATNTSIWQKAKLHVTILQAVFVHRPMRAGCEWLQVRSSVKTKTCLTALQVMRDSTMEGLVGVIDKQMQDVGAKPWYGAPAQPLALPAPEERHALEAGPCSEATELTNEDKAVSLGW